MLSPPPPVRPAPVSAPAASVELPKPDYRAVAAAHLFGQPPLPVNPKADVRHAPPTRLKLQLRGVVLTEEPGDARAIIAVPGSPERAYALGAQIPGGATLEEFYPDQVILRRDGRYETLRINIDDLPPGEIEHLKTHVRGFFQTEGHGGTAPRGIREGSPEPFKGL